MFNDVSFRVVSGIVAIFISKKKTRTARIQNRKKITLFSLRTSVSVCFIVKTYFLKWKRTQLCVARDMKITGITAMHQTFTKNVYFVTSISNINGNFYISAYVWLIMYVVYASAIPPIGLISRSDTIHFI